MLTWLSIGMILTLSAVAYVLLRWGRMKLKGEVPVATPVFIAILFTSGLDVGLIMFPLTEFPVYADLTQNPEYAFSNPLAIEFGFWGFLVWSVYFLTCFYFCALESRIGFFDIPWVKWLNNLIIIGTCAFTAHLLFANLSWYLPGFLPEPMLSIVYGVIVLCTICAAVYSSTELRFVKILSVSSGGLFFCLMLVMGIYVLSFDHVASSDYLSTVPLLGDYFVNISEFLLPINDYHGFYLYWWFAWSIMIGQFTARFVGNMQTWQLCVHMLVWPSVSIALWFTVLYVYYDNQVSTLGWVNIAMVSVGIIFVINSLDSLIRVYSDNLNLSAKKLGRSRYFILHALLLITLTVLFSLEFIRIQWIGALVVAIGLSCVLYMVIYKRKQVAQLSRV